MDRPKLVNLEAERRRTIARRALRHMTEAQHLIRAAGKAWQEAELSTELDVPLVLSLAVEHLGDAVAAARKVTG